MAEARELIEGDYFANFIDYCYSYIQDFDDGAVKKITNSWTGTFNCNYNFVIIDGLLLPDKYWKLL